MEGVDMGVESFKIVFTEPNIEKTAHINACSRFSERLTTIELANPRQARIAHVYQFSAVDFGHYMTRRLRVASMLSDSS